MPVVVPTQFVLAGHTVWLHLVRANPIFAALSENPRVLLSVADDWAFVPSSWKAIDAEDPLLGIPTTYYGAVQPVGTATVHDERTAPGHVAAILRRQLAAFQPDVEVADPSEAHAAKLFGILGIEIRVSAVTAKFKYGGNVDEAHRRAVVARLQSRHSVGGRARAAPAGGRRGLGGPGALVRVGVGVRVGVTERPVVTSWARARPLAPGWRASPPSAVRRCWLRGRP